jgi:DNA-binding MarR family transcriptional regulator
MPDQTLPIYFQFFTEIGIIDQLARARMEARLPPGLIQPHFTVINHLIRVQDGRTPLELARAFQVAKTTMTHTLAGLEKHGLVETRPNPDDGRSKRVFLTDKGRAFRDATVADLAQGFAPLMARFDAAQIAAVLPFLTEIRKFLDENRD